jgi:cell division transport system ATP-binding protein
MIEFDNVTKQYSRDAYALRDISLTIQDGELIFLAGPLVPENRLY